jgi:tRNA(Arg) A34 adenosine deaminase TadA
MESWDEQLLRRSIQVAQAAREAGNHPFGALLADGQGKVLLEAGNTVLTSRDVTGHAETNLVREATRKFSPEVLAQTTLYASTEPCPMCAGAIYWSHIGRVVFGLSQVRFYHEFAGAETHGKLELSCREVLGRGSRRVEVFGPALEDLAAKVHVGFWTP